VNFVAKARTTTVVRASVMDRLSGTHGGSGAIGLREIKQSVFRDLQWLLNSRRWWPTEFEPLEEIPTSILNYGVPDTSTYSWVAAEDQRKVCSVIENVIKTFEPRLVPRTIRVSLVEREGVDDFSVRMRIEAVLAVDPFTEAVSFDTDIDVDTGGFQMKSMS
jgi:type VI secretion system protein ImpF